MSRTVAIIATGEMGGALGATLAQHGARVTTSGAGRSEASLARARAAGFTMLDDDALAAEADYVLSVVPPNAALALAQRLRPALARAARKPVYVDCNAVAPATVRDVAGALDGTGCDVVDAGLFGGPTSGKPGVVMYVSGPHAARVAELAELGIVVRVIPGEIGAASAMKLSFAALNKGFTGLGALALLHGIDASPGPALLEQLAETQPGILAYVARFVPAMFPKAYRWAPEMEEIAAFLQHDEAARDLFAALSRFYARFARDVADQAEHVAALRAFCEDAAARHDALRKD
jgi:3-hydroxyisobutyrate dehydrogenase-like beta-hydroxyacid dehydrogenase